MSACTVNTLRSPDKDKNRCTCLNSVAVAIFRKLLIQGDNLKAA